MLDHIVYIDSLYLLCFITLVLITLLDFDNKGSFFQFTISFIAFIAYLVYLSKDNKELMSGAANVSAACEVKFSQIFDKYMSLPDEIKNIMTLEINQFINMMKGMKDAAGKDPAEQLVDKDYYSQLGETDMDDKTLLTIQEDYFLIDKVFRDLQIANLDLYMAKIYNN